MASLLGKLIGAKGHQTTRQGSKASGLVASVQSFTQIVTMRWEWDAEHHHWKAKLTRAPINYLRQTEGELLWEGILTE